MTEQTIDGHVSEVESRILQELERLGPCTLEEFVRVLPDYTWNQVFAAVDRLSRDGTVLLRRPTRFEYVVAVRTRRAS